MTRTTKMQAYDFDEWRQKIQRAKPQETLSEVWLDKQEVCRKLRMSESTLRRRVKAGIIPEPSRQLGDRMPRWPQKEIDVLMKAENKQGNAT
jgi:predicted DNA-binding transcriptional regulator AlpA